MGIKGRRSKIWWKDKDVERALCGGGEVEVDFGIQVIPHTVCVRFFTSGNLLLSNYSIFPPKKIPRSIP